MDDRVIIENDKIKKVDFKIIYGIPVQTERLENTLKENFIPTTIFFIVSQKKNK